MSRSQRTALSRPAPRQSRLLVVACLVALALAGCSDSGLGRDAARVVAGGTLEIADEDGWEPIGVDANVPDGARLRAGEESARLRMANGEVWLAAGTAMRLFRSHVDLIRGEALVVAGGPMALRWGDVEVDGVATYRVHAGVTPRVGVYDGDIEVRRPAETKAVPSLRELSLAPQRLTEAPSPLDYRHDDEWDQALLAPAIRFDEEAAQLARGVDREYGVAPRSADFYESFVAVRPTTVPVLAATSRVQEDERFGPPSDALVTLFVAQTVAEARGEAIAEALRDVATLRAAGARWGLVALEHGIGTRELAGVVDLAQERRLVLAADEPDDPAPAAAPGDAAAPGAPDDSDSAPAAEPAPQPASQEDEPSTAPPPDDSPDDPGSDQPLQEPEPVRETIDVVDEVIDGLVGDEGLVHVEPLDDVNASDALGSDGLVDGLLSD